MDINFLKLSKHVHKKKNIQVQLFGVKITLSLVISMYRWCHMPFWGCWKNHYLVDSASHLS